MKKPKISNGRLLSIRQAAEFLGVSPWTVREIVWRRQLPVIRFGSGLNPVQYLDRRDLETWIERHKAFF